MSTLADALTRITDALSTTGTPVVVGPPFTHPPSGPCYVVSVPDITEVTDLQGTCQVTGARLDVSCVPTTATDHAALLALADAAIAALGGGVVGGAVQPSDLTVEADYVYRLTVED